MPRRMIKWISILCFLLLLIYLMNFEFERLFQPKILFVVLLGTVLLGVTHKITLPKTPWITCLRINGLYAGGLTTLVYLLAYATTPTIGIEETLIPLLYGGLLYLILGYVQIKENAPSEPASPIEDPFEVGVVTSILTDKGFSPREIHVAIKIMQQLPNKDIASDLFISEATVKKHIQNMFKKCDAQDRAHFTQIYLEWYRSFGKERPTLT